MRTLKPRFYRILIGIALSAFFPAYAPAQEQLIVSVGEEWSYLKGNAPPPAEWIEPDFDDSAWLTGPTGIGYADNDDATVLTDMQNSYESIFTRKTFQVPDAGSVSSLVLRIRYDDGFVAYLNGVKVANSVNMDAVGPTDNKFLAPDHEVNATPDNFEIDESFLDDGENVLAIQVHNSTLGSTDLSFIPELVANADLCPQVITCRFDAAAQSVVLNWTNRAAYDSIAISRDGTVIEPFLAGTQTTFSDFAAPTGSVTYSVAATHNGEECTAPLQCTVRTFPPSAIVVNAGETWKYWRGSFAPPFDWYIEGIDDATWQEGQTGIGYGDGDDITVLDDMIQRMDDPATIDVDESQPGYLTVFMRKEFQVASLDGVQGVLSIIYDDGFVAYVNDTEIGRVNMPVDFVNETTPALAAIDPVQTDIPIPAGVLRVGTNLIALSIHNANLTSSDLSAIPVVALPGGSVGSSFRRGDVDSSGIADLSDAVNILNHLFQGTPAPVCSDSADVTDDGILDLTDSIVLLNHLFLGEPEPPSPGLSCGPDPTADALGDCSTLGC